MMGDSKGGMPKDPPAAPTSASLRTGLCLNTSHTAPTGKATPLPSSPVWKNFPEYPRLKVKFGMWVRSSFCVSNSAWEGGRESKMSSAHGHRDGCHARARTCIPESFAEGLPWGQGMLWGQENSSLQHPRAGTSTHPTHPLPTQPGHHSRTLTSSTFMRVPSLPTKMSSMSTRM